MVLAFPSCSAQDAHTGLPTFHSQKHCAPPPQPALTLTACTAPGGRSAARGCNAEFFFEGFLTEPSLVPPLLLLHPHVPPTPLRGGRCAVGRSQLLPDPMISTCIFARRRLGRGHAASLGWRGYDHSQCVSIGESMRIGQKLGCHPHPCPEGSRNYFARGPLPSLAFLSIQDPRACMALLRSQRRAASGTTTVKG